MICYIARWRPRSLQPVQDRLCVCGQEWRILVSEGPCWNPEHARDRRSAPGARVISDCKPARGLHPATCRGRDRRRRRRRGACQSRRGFRWSYPGNPMGCARFLLLPNAKSKSMVPKLKLSCSKLPSSKSAPATTPSQASYFFLSRVRRRQMDSKRVQLPVKI